MPYLFMLAPCYTCKKPFVCNPQLVPSVVIDGKREPLCRACVETANPLRIARGLEAIRILPGAYDAQGGEL